MPKLHIKLKNGEDREYYLNEVNFVVTSASNMFIVRDTVENLIFAASMDRIEYYERIEE
ncbi:hypothetical protein J6O48_08320 [bacterium]|nr:hypothetical protein [bacterium]